VRWVDWKFLIDMWLLSVAEFLDPYWLDITLTSPERLKEIYDKGTLKVLS